MPTGSAAISAVEPVRPLGAAEFDRAMARLGPFEPRPLLAVGVSGGPDSLALLLLLEAWTARRAGRLVVLTVDHRLRPESAAEAEAVGRLCRARGLEHHTLVREGPRPARRLQAAAREARLKLLESFCAARGIFHLCLAHQRDDQAETLLLRLAAGSDQEGLACIPARRRLGELRLLRPLLSVPKARLVATLEAAGLAFFDDPSNRDPRYLRTGVRALLPVLAEAGLGADRLAEVAALFARLRSWSDRAVAELLAAAACPHPAGFLRLEAAALAGAPRPLARKALLRVLLAVGGRAYPPSPLAVERLLARLLAERAAPLTLAGCRFLKSPKGGAGPLLVVREARHLPQQEIAPGGGLLWDGRFLLRLSGAAPAARAFRVGALGQGGWRALAGLLPEEERRRLPAAVRPVLPALFDLDGPAAVPHLNYYRNGTSPGWLLCRYRPRHSLTDAPFTGAAR